jgi:predicted Zn-dependent peptidase
VVRATALPWKRDGPLFVHLEFDPSRTDALGEALNPSAAGARLVEEAKSILSRPPTERELDRAKTYTIGSYALSHQRVRDRAFYLGWYELLGLGHEFDIEFPSLIASVNLEQVQASARAYLQHQVVVSLLPSQ